MNNNSNTTTIAAVVYSPRVVITHIYINNLPKSPLLFGRSALQYGSSRPWPEVLKLLTGTSKVDVGPLMEFFSPLIDWLKATNQKEGNNPGWAPHGCPSLR